MNNREAFEADAKMYGYDLTQSMCGCCEYLDDSTNSRWMGWESATDYYSKEIKRLNSIIAMKDEALKGIQLLIGYEWLLPEFNQAREALSTSPESLSAWEAEKLLPLQRIVASINFEINRNYGEFIDDKVRAEDALKNLACAIVYTQATAEAFLNEYAAKVREDFIKTLRALPSIGLSERQFGELKLAAELRAENKNGGE